MLEESKEREDRSAKFIKFLNTECYTAIMDEDLGRIEDMSKKYGRNFLIEIQGGAPGEVFLKVDTTMQHTVFKIICESWNMYNVSFTLSHGQKHSILLYIL